MNFKSLFSIRSLLSVEWGNKKKFIAIAGLLLLVGLGGGIGLAALMLRPSVTIPTEVASKVLFPVYIPTSLPNNLYIPQSSFKFVEGALLFYATDEHDRRLSFSQQPRPNDFDFQEFYKTQLTESKSVQGVAHPTVIGNMPDDMTMVSIVTSDTWIIITSQTVISEEEAHIIAKSLVKQ